MSRRLTRRTFVGLTSGAALSIVHGDTWLRGQSPWTLTAQVIPVASGFGLLVTFGVDPSPSIPLYIQVADSDGPDIFFSWTGITEPAGADLLQIGPFGIPYGRRYLVTIVTALGNQDPLSPLVSVDIPALPDPSF